ncbi:unnamed protein product [Symbiodinium sp. CCMP2592]|nr:unnamed protein product [Symbiodinium sp. CCMP2592]
MVEFGIPKLCILCLLLLCEPKHPERSHIDVIRDGTYCKHNLIQVVEQGDPDDGEMGRDALVGLGYAISAHDIEHHPSMDINSSAGFAWLILASFLSLKRAGPRWVAWVRDAPAGLFVMGVDESPHLPEKQLFGN